MCFNWISTALSAASVSKQNLCLIGGVPDFQYGSAVVGSMPTLPTRTSTRIIQSVVLVTAYSMKLRGVIGSNIEVLLSALSAALTSQVRHDAGEGPQVHVVPVSTLSLSEEQAGNIARVGRLLRGSSAAEPGFDLMAGVIIYDFSARQQPVLEDRLADASFVTEVWKAVNNRLEGTGASILNLMPGLVVPSVMLDVNCTRSEAFDMDATQWADTVRTAAETQSLQQPDDVWVFVSGSAGLVPVSEDFQSVKLRRQRVVPWHALLFWGGATLAAASVALAVYMSLSQNRWHQPRNKMWEGYSAIGGPAVAVAEGISSTSSPFSMSDLSPMSRSSVRIRLARNSSVVDYYRVAPGYGQLAPVEQTWSDSTGQAASLMHPLVVCRQTDDELPESTTMPSLPSGVSFDSQLRSVARCGCAGASDI